jgi:hypothetical protein
MVDRVPLCVPSSIVERVDFVGRAMRTLQQRRLDGATEWHDALLDRFGTAFNHAPLDFNALNETLEQLQSDVSTRLWTILHAQCALLKHVDAFKNYFLLGRGEFIESLLVDLDAMPIRKASLTEYGVSPWAVGLCDRIEQGVATRGAKDDGGRRSTV